MRGRSAVRKLVPSDAGAYVQLRRRALESDPQAFTSSVEDDPAMSLEFVEKALADALREQELCILGAFHPGLVGILGIAREREIKARHKLRLWGMYVAPERRRAGLGQSLLSEAYDVANAMGGVEQIHLRVSVSSQAAVRLFERFGFERFGVERRALKIAGRYVDEHLMVVNLPDEAA
jgi:ribosomal protein S18 acetylase RimI-like enzyme